MTSYRLTASYMDFISGRWVLTQKMACWLGNSVGICHASWGSLAPLPGHAHLTSQCFSSVLRTESHPPKPVKSVFWLPPARSFGIVPVCMLFICTISIVTREEPLHPPAPRDLGGQRWEMFWDAGRLGRLLLVINDRLCANSVLITLSASGFVFF